MVQLLATRSLILLYSRRSLGDRPRADDLARTSRPVSRARALLFVRSRGERGCEPALTCLARTSLVISLCMALDFFNLLPLPHLDGAHILSAFLNALSGSELPVTASARGTTGASVRGEADRGLLSQAIRRLSGVGRVARLAERRDRLERGLRRWTMVVGGVTLAATLVVEVASARARW